jgi:protein-S-isoprenylcysteine O-methyltransferase Ste14
MRSSRPNLGILLLVVFSTLLFLGLPALGWRGWEALIANPVRACACAVVVLASFAVAFSSANGEGFRRPDAHGRWIILPVLVFSLLLAWLPAETDRRDLWTLDGEGVRWLGLVLLVVGCVLRVGPMFVLGRRFTWPLASQEEHRLVTSGFYRYIRHPSYLGALLGGIGWVLVFRSAIGLVLLLVLCLSFGWTVAKEEALLLTEFGDEYEAYRRRTWRMIPFVY